LSSHRIGKAEIRMPDHSPDPANAPVDQRFDHDVAAGSNVWLFLRKRDVYAVVAHLDRERLDTVIEIARRLSGDGVEVPAMPGAAQQAFLDGALPQGTPLMRALVVERSKLSFEMAQAERPMLAGDRFDAAFGKLPRLENLEPNAALTHSNAFREVRTFHDRLGAVKDVQGAGMLQIACESLDFLGRFVVDHLFDVFLAKPDHTDVLRKMPLLVGVERADLVHVRLEVARELD